MLAVLSLLLFREHKHCLLNALYDTDLCEKCIYWFSFVSLWESRKPNFFLPFDILLYVVFSSTRLNFLTSLHQKARFSPTDSSVEFREIPTFNIAIFWQFKTVKTVSIVVLFCQITTINCNFLSRFAIFCHCRQFLKILHQFTTRMVIFCQNMTANCYFKWS